MALIKVSDNPELFELRMQPGETIMRTAAGTRASLNEWQKYFHDLVMESFSHVSDVRASAELELSKVRWAAREEAQERAAWYYHDRLSNGRASTPLTDQSFDTPTMKRLGELEWAVMQCRIALERLAPIYMWNFGHHEWMFGDGGLDDAECEVWLEEFEKWLNSRPNDLSLFLSQGHTFEQMKAHFESGCTPAD